MLLAVYEAKPWNNHLSRYGRTGRALLTLWALDAGETGVAGQTGLTLDTLDTRKTGVAGKAGETGLTLGTLVAWRACGPFASGDQEGQQEDDDDSNPTDAPG